VSNQVQPSKSARRDTAREHARLAREEKERRAKRNRILLQSGIGVAILAIALIVVLVLTNMSNAVVPVGSSPSNMRAGGILFVGSNGKMLAHTAKAAEANDIPTPAGDDHSAGVAHVVTYIDWSCPVCKQFEAAFSAQIQKLVASGEATLEIHPIAILDRNYKGSRYSSRAANAAACVANLAPDKFLAAQAVMFTNQPEEQSAGLTNAQINGLLKSAGAGSSGVINCVNRESFKAWVASSTSRTVSEKPLVDPSTGSFGTPTVFVDGTRWNGSADLIAMINAAAAK
jgi:protein-disulfide isomerase